MFEAGPSADKSNEMGRVHSRPPGLGGLNELEDHGQCGSPGSCAFGDLGPQSHGGEGRLDRVGGPQVDPVLGGEVEERQQLVLVICDPLDDLGVLSPVSPLEVTDGPGRVLLVLGVVDLLDRTLGRGLGGLREGVEHICSFMHPAPLVASVGEHLVQRVPKAERAVADGQGRSTHAPAGAVPQQTRPRLGRFAVAVCHRDQFLRAVGAYTHQHQYCGLRFPQAYPQVHAVRPHVHVVRAGQVTVLEGGMVGLPLCGQPGHRRGRQAS